MKPTYFHIQFLFLILLTVHIPLSTDAQTVSLISATKSFLVGETINIQTDSIHGLKGAVSNKKPFTFIINKLDLKNVQAQIYGANILWTITLPNSNIIIGKDVKVSIVINDVQKADFTIPSIYANAPLMTALDPMVFYNDIDAYQNILFKFNNYAFLNTIKFKDPKIVIQGGNTATTIDSKNPSFMINESDRTILLRAKLRGVTSLEFTTSYTKEDQIGDETPSFDPGATFINKFQAKSFQIKSPTLFEDDFTGSDIPVTFDFSSVTPAPIPGEYAITISSPVTTSISFLTSNLQLTAAKDYVLKLKRSDKYAPQTYQVTIASTSGASSGQKFNSEFIVWPNPIVDHAKIFGHLESGALLVDRILNSKQLLVLTGASGINLDAIPGLDVEIVSVQNTGEPIGLLRSQAFIKGSIIAELPFNDGKNLIAPGNYIIQVKRRIDQRVFPFVDSNGANIYLKIDFPKFINPAQDYFVRLSDSTQFPRRLSKRFVNKKNIVMSDSPIILQIIPRSDLYKSGPQYMMITADYFDSKGVVNSFTMKENKNDFIRIYDSIKFLNLRTSFGIKNDLLPEETITVRVSHATEVYGSTNQAPGYTIVYRSYVNPLDRFGLTFSLPPYLVAFKSVKGKTIIKDSSGNVTDVKFDQPAQTQFQSLTINAGLGLKYRWRDNKYQDSRFAIGMYFMGLDFANGKSKTDQLNDPTNKDFITRGSFNLMLLGEFSIFNLDNPNLRIPLYFGQTYVISPLDGGSHWAWTVGLGVDIKAFGHN